jgi:membrane protein DedA with SNARE-associated domain
VLLVHASLTEPIVKLATHLIADLGLAGVALMVLSAGVIGLPGSELPMLFAGFDVYQGNLSLPGIIVAGVIGDVAGASIAYAIGYYGSQELLDRQGSKLHIKPGSIERAHRWFEQYGMVSIFISRFLPFVRAAFPYAAGVARMPFWRLFTMALCGSVFWIGGIGVLGRAVGSKWDTWHRHLEYVDYVGVVVVVGAIIYLIVRRQRGGPAEPATSVQNGTVSSGKTVDAVPD